MLVLLDLDGTLTDPFAGMSRSFRHMFMSVGVQPPDEAGLRRLIGPPFNQSLPQLGVPMSRVDEAIIAYRSVYDAGGAMFDAHVYDGIPEALDALLAAGHILALATSKPEIPAAKIVSHFGLASRLAFVGGATADGSRQHKADVIEHVLRTVGV